MFGWRKRDDGFEWHKYIRTTIKLRREARRERAQQLGAQVAGGARAAGVAAGEAARSAGFAAGAAARSGAAGFGVIVARSLAWLAQAGGALGRGLGQAAQPALDILGRPAVSGPLIFAGLIAATAGLVRAAAGGAGIDHEAATALAIAAVLLLAGLGPRLWLGYGLVPVRPKLAPIEGLPPRRWLLAGGALAAVAGLALALPLLGGGRLGLPTVASLSGLSLGGVTTVKGRASVLGADTLRVGESRVRLSGLEALDREQRCLRPTTAGARTPARGWACGEEAREALTRLAQGRDVTCEVGAKDGQGTASGRCTVGAIDLGEALVAAGHAFAEPGIVSPYRSAEATARTQRQGVWGAAEPERPAQWRDRMWTTAKRQAPDGCPIKGRVQGGERLYVLPWSAEYERVRLSKRRGERWFCSEDEAIAAGWRSARRG